MRLIDRLRVRAPGWLVRVETTEQICALTFDDGPDPDSTPTILDILAAHGARATFFVDADQAAANPQIIQRARAEGHSIGSHSRGHRSAFFDRRGGSLRNQLSSFRTSTRQIDAAVRWLRPPYGHESRSTRLAAMLAGLRLVYWSATADDWRVDTPQELAERLGDAIRPGGIVLLHDGLLTATDQHSFDRDDVAVALNHVLDRSPGWRFVTIDALVASGRPVMRWRRRRPAAIDGVIRRPDDSPR